MNINTKIYQVEQVEQVKIDIKTKNVLYFVEQENKTSEFVELAMENFFFRMLRKEFNDYFLNMIFPFFSCGIIMSKNKIITVINNAIICYQHFLKKNDKPIEINQEGVLYCVVMKHYINDDTEIKYVTLIKKIIFDKIIEFSQK